MARAFAARGRKIQIKICGKKTPSGGPWRAPLRRADEINEKQWKINRKFNHAKRWTSSSFNYIISQRDQNLIKTDMRAPSRINVLHVDDVCKVFCTPRCSQTPTKWINLIWRKGARHKVCFLFFSIVCTFDRGGMLKYYFDRGACQRNTLTGEGVLKKYFDRGGLVKEILWQGGMSKKYFDRGHDKGAYPVQQGTT